MIRAILARPLAVTVGAGSLIVLGLVSLIRLPISLLPALERPRVEGTVELPGVSRDEARRDVTVPLERELAAVPGALRVETATRDERVDFRVETEWDTDPDRFRVELERRIANVTETGRVVVEMAAGDRDPVMEIGVLGGSAGQRAAFVDRVLRPELARLPGAGRVEVLGAAPRHVVVTPRWAELAARGLSVRELAERLGGLGNAVSLGRARLGGEVRPLVLREEVGSLAELGRLTVEGPRGISTVSDLASLGVEDVPGRDLFRVSGGEGTLVRLFRAPGGNAVRLSAEARDVIRRLGANRTGGLELRVVHDASREVTAALRELGVAAALGLVLGTFFLRWMLGRWRPTFALALVIPSSIVGSLTAFYAFGLSLDLVALAGLALAAGLLVDNSIVVLESIERSLADGVDEPVARGAARVALPVVAGVLTTAVVFLPLVYLRGLARAFFGVQAFAIVASLLVSLLASFTVTPVLAGRRSAAAGAGRHPGIGVYRSLLERCLNRPFVAVLTAVLGTVAGLGLLLARPRELLPHEPTSELELTYRLPPHRTPASARAIAEAWVAGVLREAEAIAGSPVPWVWTQEPEATRFEGDREDGRLELRLPSPRAAARLEAAFRRAGIDAPEVRAQIRSLAGALLQAVEASKEGVTVEASAASSEGARELAARAEQELTARGARVTRGSDGAAIPTWWARPRPNAVMPATFDETVRAALDRRELGRVGWEGVEPSILLDPEPDRPERIPLGDGVPLVARARLEPGVSVGTELRVDGRSASRLRVELPAGLDPLDLASVLRDIPVRTGETLRPGGEAFELARSFRQLGGTLALSALLVFLAVAALFESWRLPLLVLATVPVALAGAGIALAATGGSLNLMSFLGLVVLVGIVVNNSIVLLHRAEEARTEAGRRRAVVTAAGERYRPILLTTLTTIAGLLPLALLGGEGIAMRRALATTLVGGLVSGLLASLLLVPVLYRGMESGEGEG